MLLKPKPTTKTSVSPSFSMSSATACACSGELMVPSTKRSVKVQLPSLTSSEFRKYLRTMKMSSRPSAFASSAIAWTTLCAKSSLSRSSHGAASSWPRRYSSATRSSKRPAPSFTWSCIAWRLRMRLSKYRRGACASFALLRKTSTSPSWSQSRATALPSRILILEVTSASVSEPPSSRAKPPSPSPANSAFGVLAAFRSRTSTIPSPSASSASDISVEPPSSVSSLRTRR